MAERLKEDNGEMKYYIDQSGKVEDTAKNTVLCLSNGNWDAIFIKAKVKREIQETFRHQGILRNYVLSTFCAALSILIKRNTKIGKITIDREYYGKESIIRAVLGEMLLEEKKYPLIDFGLVGKSSKVHFLAKTIFLGKKSGATVDKKQILMEIKKTEVGKRLKNT